MPSGTSYCVERLLTYWGDATSAQRHILDTLRTRT